jgi:hypothetical protein
VNNTPPQSNSSSIDAIFVQLNQHDIEEFYTGYQCWNLRQQNTALQTRIGDLHQQIAENTQRMQEVQPTAIALATLARIQSNGVSDIDLLDRMLERGELWLDRTMQRLEYFEQLDDFISDDYTQWCQLALEGAYDWIDSMLDGSPPSSSPVAASKEEELTEATEELFLQKLSSDEYEDESSLLETTLKRPAITIAHPSEPLPPSEDIPVALGVAPIVDEATPAQEETFPENIMLSSALPAEEGLTQEYMEAEVTQTPEEVLSYEEPFSEEETATLDAEQPKIRAYITPDSSDDTTDSVVEEPPLQENVAPEEPLSVKSSSISASEELSMQEFVEVSPATKESPSTSLETPQQSIEHAVSEVPSSANISEALEQHQQNKPQKRPSFIRRFIGKIWGSQA